MFLLMSEEEGNISFLQFSSCPASSQTVAVAVPHIPCWIFCSHRASPDISKRVLLDCGMPRVELPEPFGAWLQEVCEQHQGLTLQSRGVTHGLLEQLLAMAGPDSVPVLLCCSQTPWERCPTCVSSGWTGTSSRSCLW